MRLHDFARTKIARSLAGAGIAVATLAGAVRLLAPGAGGGFSGAASAAQSDAQPEDKAAPDSVVLTESQLRRFKIAPVDYRVFTLDEPAIGNIDFNEDMQTQVFTPYQGRIISLNARIGDDVKKGDLLFTIDSPDLLQAESTLISTAGVLRLTTRALERAKDLYSVKGIAQKDYDQAISDQQGAEGNYKAAADAVRIFGKTSADIERIAATRKVDASLFVNSPISGRVTARSASPGLFVQPGNAPAPFTVSDLSTMWMLANVPESASPRFRQGQPVSVSIQAFPGKVFTGKITTIGSTVDPNTRRVFLRSEIADPQHLLRSGMFATFVISTGDPMRSLAVPSGGIAREGDGTMTAWVTTDRKTFTQRTVTLGLVQDDYNQVLDGLKPGELIAADGALFLNNALNGVDE
jgi:cobalt-zinc-cadmium efflux system membrane fusion protein